MADFTGRIRRIRIRENQNDTSFRTVVVVVGDTNQEVKFVEVKFDNPEQVPAPTPTVMVPTQTRYNPEKEVSRFVYKPLTFANGAKPIETKYTMTAQMKAADGTNLGGPYTESVIVEDKDTTGGDDGGGGDPTATFTGRIHRIRIRENQNDTSFRIIVVVTDDTVAQQVAFVKCNFNSTTNPAPIPTSAICSLVEVNAEKNNSRFLFSPLSFKDGVRPLEDIYNMTATMLKSDGTPIGDSVTRDVIVETTDASDAV